MWCGCVAVLHRPHLRITCAPRGSNRFVLPEPHERLHQGLFAVPVYPHPRILLRSQTKNDEVNKEGEQKKKSRDGRYYIRGASNVSEARNLRALYVVSRLKPFIVRNGESATR